MSDEVVRALAGLSTDLVEYSDRTNQLLEALVAVEQRKAVSFEELVKSHREFVKYHTRTVD